MFEDFFKAVLNYEEFADALKELPEEQRWKVIRSLMVGVLRCSFQDEASAQKAFDICEKMGGHLLPVHFYSPVPDLTHLDSAAFQRKYELGFDAGRQLEFVRTVTQYVQELEDIPQTGTEGELHWKNPAFCVGDGALYYCILRHLRPRLVLEVGSGYSTLFARRAAPERLEAIEPYPYPWLERVVDRLIRQPVQQVALEEFDRLRENDVFFIDSTHVVKPGSDVVYLFLEVLPRLHPGVVVHVHDIFLPYEYPEHWVRGRHLFWNEQYLAAALVQGGGWEVLAANQWLGREHAEELRALIPYTDLPGGASLWIRKLR